MNLGIAPATGSPKGTLNTQDWAFIKFVLLHVFVGAALTALVQIVGHFNFGVYQPVVTLVLSSISSVVTQLLNGK